MLLMAQVEQHTMWEELNTLQNTVVQPEHEVLISSLLIWTPMSKIISLKTFPVTHSKWEKAQKALVENCWLSPYAHLALFRLVTCPSTACCGDALLQDMGTTRRCQDNMSQGSEERDEIGVMGEPSSADIWSPVWELFFVLFVFTPVYRTSMWGWILWIWSKTTVTSNIPLQATGNARICKSAVSPFLTRNFLNSWYQSQIIAFDNANTGKNKIRLVGCRQ